MKFGLWWWLLCTSRIRNIEVQSFLQQFEHLQSTKKENRLIIVKESNYEMWPCLIEFFKFWEIHRLIISSICRYGVSNNSWFLFDVFIISWYRCNQWFFRWSCKNDWFTLCTLKIFFFIDHTFDRTCINQISSSSWTGRCQCIGRSITSSCCRQHRCVCRCSLKAKIYIFRRIWLRIILTPKNALAALAVFTDVSLSSSIEPSKDFAEMHSNKVVKQIMRKICKN